MTAGRKALPPQTAKILNFPGKRKPRKDLPKTANDLPSAPDYLNKRATELFGRLAARLDQQKLASSSHTEMLALLASRLEEVESLSKVLQEGGRTYETTNTQGDICFKARPEVAMKNEAMRHAQSLLAEFGLSPAAVNKVSARSGDEEEDPLRDYL